MPGWKLEAIDDPDEGPWTSHPQAKAQLAHDTARLLVGRQGGVTLPQDVIHRLDRYLADGGLDDLAALWAESGPTSLPGALWRLYRVREQLLARPDELARLISLGHDHLDTIDPILAGMAEPVTRDSVVALADDVFSGAMGTTLPDALERAGALAKVVARGLLIHPHEGDESYPLARTSLAWEVVGAELLEAARLDRRGGLS
jgi:hypothetical protein